MAAKVQILVEAKDGASGVLRGITSQFGAFGSVIEEVTGSNVAWGNIAARATEMVVNGLQQSIKATQEYAAEVRDLSLASGATAEQSSRLLQVLDDYEISAQDVTAATKALTKSGLEPSIETIAKLADQYIGLNTAQEKNEFIIKNLGRGGLQWANALSQGGDALRALNEDVGSNLILTDEQIAKTEKYRHAVDEWNETIEGIQIAAGFEAIVALTDAMGVLNEYFQRHNTEAETAQDKWSNIIGVIFPAAKGFETLGDFIKIVTDKVGENKEKVDLAVPSFRELESGIRGAGKASQDTATIFGAQLSMMEKLNNATKEQIKLAAYQDLKTKLSEGGISDEEAALLEKAGQYLGIFDSNASGAAKSIDTLNRSLAEGKMDLLAYVAALNKIPTNISTTVTTNYTTTGNPNSVVPIARPGENVRAAGGTVYAGQPYLVGERGAETFMPSTNGRILGHQESLNAMAQGGGTNYFYGNVTLSIDEDSAGGILGYR